jgi:hypothetical protein
LLSDNLQDRIAAGLGQAGRKLGLQTDIFRPRDAGPALAAANRFMRLAVAFHIGKGFTEPASPGVPFWQAMLDSAYTKPGDYLVQGSSIWFIASQPRLLPVLCVQTNRRVHFSRPARADHVGPGDYAAMRAETMRPLLTDWPAAMQTASRQGGAQPGDGLWRVLLPAIPGMILQPGDRMTDDLHRACIVVAADLSATGWDLRARETQP